MNKRNNPFGRHSLTDLEVRIISQFVQGRTRVIAADMLGTSKSSLDNHLRLMFAMLGVHSMVELVVMALSNGFDTDGRYTPRTGSGPEN